MERRSGWKKTSFRQSYGFIEKQTQTTGKWQSTEQQIGKMKEKKFPGGGSSVTT